MRKTYTNLLFYLLSFFSVFMQTACGADYTLGVNSKEQSRADGRPERENQKHLQSDLYNKADQIFREEFSNQEECIEQPNEYFEDQKKGADDSSATSTLDSSSLPPLSSSDSIDRDTEEDTTIEEDGEEDSDDEDAGAK